MRSYRPAAWIRWLEVVVAFVFGVLAIWAWRQTDGGAALLLVAASACWLFVAASDWTRSVVITDRYLAVRTTSFRRWRISWDDITDIHRGTFADRLELSGTLAGLTLPLVAERFDLFRAIHSRIPIGDPEDPAREYVDGATNRDVHGSVRGDMDLRIQPDVRPGPNLGPNSGRVSVVEDTRDPLSPPSERGSSAREGGGAGVETTPLDLPDRLAAGSQYVPPALAPLPDLPIRNRPSPPTPGANR